MSQILRFCFLLGAVYSFIDIPLPRYCDDLNIQSVSKYYDVFAVLSDCMDHLYISKSTGSHMPIIDVIYPYPDFTFNGVIHINSHSLIVGAVSESDDAVFIYKQFENYWRRVAIFKGREGLKQTSLTINGNIASAIYFSTEVDVANPINFADYDIITYKEDLGIWSENGRIVPADVTDWKSTEFRPRAMALHENSALVTGHYSNENKDENGALLFSNMDSTGWTQTTRIVPVDSTIGATTAVSIFGCAAQLRSNLAVILSCVKLEDSNHIADKAYVFVFSEGLWIQESLLTISPTYSNRNMTWTDIAPLIEIASDESAITIGGIGAQIKFTKDGATWKSAIQVKGPIDGIIKLSACGNRILHTDIVYSAGDTNSSGIEIPHQNNYRGDLVYGLVALLMLVLLTIVMVIIGWPYIRKLRERRVIRRVDTTSEGAV